jgi:alkaline phosphatase
MSEKSNARTDQAPSPPKRTFSKLVVSILAFVVLVNTLRSLVVLKNFFDRPTTIPEPAQHEQILDQNRKRNVIFMVSDGMGPASLSLTRSFRQYQQGLEYNDILDLDQYFIGHSRTRSSSSLVTDSAAGATAFSCGKKSYNGAIAILPDHSPCGTVLEAAKLAGYHTGMVVTTRITDATPASFAAHANQRFEEDLIAQHELGYYPLGRVVDLMIGGGRCHFLPQSLSGGCRGDDRNLIEEAVSEGWTYVGNRDSFDSLASGENVTLPLLALLAPGDIPFEIDREEEIFPSLEETAKTAIRALELATKDSSKGFFLLIEGSRIDHAGHQNDPAAQVREVLAYDAAFKAAIDFANSSEVETIVLSTSDHETGGLSTARQITASYPEYLWYPEVLDNVRHSAEYLGSQLARFKGQEETLEKFIEHHIFKEGLGFTDFSKRDVQMLLRHKDNAADMIAYMISVRSEIGWSTHGHSAVDVNVYGFGPNEQSQQLIMQQLAGSNENTDIGDFMASYLAVDTGAVTDILQDHHSKVSETQFEWTEEPYEEILMDEYHVREEIHE